MTAADAALEEAAAVEEEDDAAAFDFDDARGAALSSESDADPSVDERECDRRLLRSFLLCLLLLFLCDLESFLCLPSFLLLCLLLL